MGQKVHPVGIRLGISTDWNSTWYAGSQDYANYLNEDMAVRKLLKKKLAHASVSRIQIDRPARAVVITIHTCLLYTSPSPRDRQKSRMPSSA